MGELVTIAPPEFICKVPLIVVIELPGLKGLLNFTMVFISVVKVGLTPPAEMVT